MSDALTIWQVATFFKTYFIHKKHSVPFARTHRLAHHRADAGIQRFHSAWCYFASVGAESNRHPSEHPMHFFYMATYASPQFAELTLDCEPFFPSRLKQ